MTNRNGQRGAEALLESPLLDRLTFLSVEAHRLTKPIQAAFRLRRSESQAIYA